MRWHCGAAHRWKGAAGGNLFRVDLRRQMKCDVPTLKLCTLSIYRPKSFEGNGDKHISCRQQCIFGSLASSSLLSYRTCRDCTLRQVLCSTSVDHCGIPGHASSSRPGNECGTIGPLAIGSQKTRWFLHAWNICTLQMFQE